MSNSQQHIIIQMAFSVASLYNNILQHTGDEVGQF